MSESHVVSGLVAKRSELAGLIDHHQKEIDRLTGDLVHLDAAIKLFSPEFDLGTIKRKQYRRYPENREGFLVRHLEHLPDREGPGAG